jgi:polyhydroxybutyrate depolymerase
VLLAAVGCASEPADEPPADTDIVDTEPPAVLDPLGATVHEDRTWSDRSYILHAPAGIDLGRGTPVVLASHGATPSFVDAAFSHAAISEMEPHADEHGYLLVFPRARVFDSTSYWPDLPEGQADIDFIEAMLADLDEEFDIDEDAVYATGFSSGGYFSYMLAEQRPGLIAGIGPVAAGSYGSGVSTPVMAFHGTDDARVSQASGLSAVEASAVVQGCDATPTTSYEQGDVTCSRWTGCADDQVVEFCLAQGAGHTWPGSEGSETLLGAYGEGETTFDIVATDYMWERLHLGL